MVRFQQIPCLPFKMHYPNLLVLTEPYPMCEVLVLGEQEEDHSTIAANSTYESQHGKVGQQQPTLATVPLHSVTGL